MASEARSPALRDVLEADPIKLEQIALCHPAASSPEAAYAHVRRAYMANDQLALADLLTLLKDAGPSFGIVSHLALLRMCIREEEADRSLAMGPVTSYSVDSGLEPLWRAEALHLIAVCHELSGRDAEARASYLAAYQCFADHESPLRAAVSYHNAIAAASRIDPNRRWFIEYDRAFHLAMAAGDRSTAGVALNNLAREFQLLGSPRAALKRAKQAVSLLQNTHFGSYQYLLALANRCDIQLDLGLHDAAAADFEELCCTSLSEARGAAAILHQKASAAGLTWRLPPEGPLKILPTWAERRPRSPGAVPMALSITFTAMESTLIEALAEGPQNTAALIERLYGLDGNFIAKENRLKQLLHRIKKKAPQLIIRLDGKYMLGQDAV